MRNIFSTCKGNIYKSTKNNTFNLIISGTKLHKDVNRCLCTKIMLAEDFTDYTKLQQCVQFESDGINYIVSPYVIYSLSVNDLGLFVGHLSEDIVQKVLEKITSYLFDESMYTLSEAKKIIEDEDIRRKARIELEVEKEIEEKESTTEHISFLNSSPHQSFLPGSDINLNIDEIQYLEARRMIKDIKDEPTIMPDDSISNNIPDKVEVKIPEAPVVEYIEKENLPKSSKKKVKAKSTKKTNSSKQKHKRAISINKDNALDFIYCYYNSDNDDDLSELYPNISKENFTKAMNRAKDIYLKNNGDPMEITKIMINGSPKRRFNFFTQKENVEMFLKDYSKMTKEELEEKYTNCFDGKLSSVFYRAKYIWLKKYGDEKSLNKLMGVKKK